jgi:hypothetical protein
VKSDTAGVQQFLAWCAAQDAPGVLDWATVNAFIAAVLDSGAEPATARSRQLAVRRFSAWCAEEAKRAAVWGAGSDAVERCCAHPMDP